MNRMRSPLSKTPPPDNPLKRSGSEGSERVVALDAKTGAEKWVHEYECEYKNVSYNAGPRTTPAIDGDRVYTLGTMGDLRCLDIKDGKAVFDRDNWDITDQAVREGLARIDHEAVGMSE